MTRSLGRERQPVRVKAVDEFNTIAESWVDFPQQLTNYVENDFIERERLGVESYGTPLHTHNGRDALVDAYEELLDAFMYLTQYGSENDWDEYSTDLALSNTASAIREIVYMLNGRNGAGFLSGRRPQPDPIQVDNRTQLGYYDDDYYVAVTDGEE